MNPLGNSTLKLPCFLVRNKLDSMSVVEGNEIGEVNTTRGRKARSERRKGKEKEKKVIHRAKECVLQIHQEPQVNLESGITGARVWDGAIALAKYLEHRFQTSLEEEGATALPMRVIELGSGTGACGLATACLLPPGSKVVITDMDRHLRLLNRNIRANASLLETVGVNVSAKKLHWGLPLAPGNADLFGVVVDASHGDELIPSDFFPRDGADEDKMATVDLLIGSDCIYHETVVEMLMQSIFALFYPSHGYPDLANGQHNFLRYYYRVLECVMAFELRSSEVTEFFLEKCYRYFEVEHLNDAPGYENPSIVLLRLTAKKGAVLVDSLKMNMDSELVELERFH
jgi:predicted nicotinamide N-methyase